MRTGNIFYNKFLYLRKHYKSYALSTKIGNLIDYYE